MPYGYGYGFGFRGASPPWPYVGMRADTAPRPIGPAQRRTLHPGPQSRLK
jgi:hypothetical protein